MSLTPTTEGRLTRAEMMAEAVSNVIRDIKFPIPHPTACEASCLAAFRENKAALQQCKDDCKASAMLAEIAERMHRQLAKNFFEVIWTKGNIDPVPDLAKQIIARFAEEASTLK
jgi:hypothetical protein